MADQRRDVPQRPGDLGSQLIAAVAESSSGRGRSSLRSPSRIFEELIRARRQRRRDREAERLGGLGADDHFEHD
jgi:hypothetical protein